MSVNNTLPLLEPRRAEPSIPVTDPRFVYRSAAATDVTITWRKFGWVPKGEVK